MPHAQAIAREDVGRRASAGTASRPSAVCRAAPEVDVRTLLGGGDGPAVALLTPPE
jgi:hypothetical protein